MELVAHLRQMGDSLRANAERILRDVQGIHSQMVAKLDRIERSTRLSSPTSEGDAGAVVRPRSRVPSRDEIDGGDIGDVPEFIPRR
jgi:hypothetical protein